MCLDDEERVGNNDRVLVVVTNQYMFDQVLWYHSKYPEGIWDALVIKFGLNNKLLNIMKKKCETCNFFDNIVCYDNGVNGKPMLKKVVTMFKYIFQYLTCSREKNDIKMIKKLMGRCDYKKVIIHSTHCIISVAAINAMRDKILICLEDGLADFQPTTGMKHIKELLNYSLAKMNVVNISMYGHKYKMKYDNRMIKYSSLPKKLELTNENGYKIVKQLFEDDVRKYEFSTDEKLLAGKKYDLILFSTAFSDFVRNGNMYDELHEWLKDNHYDKKILIKLHPREVNSFCWEDLDYDIAPEDMGGELLIDLFPKTDLLCLFCSTLLLKIIREKRKFKVIYFESINSDGYRDSFMRAAGLLKLGTEDIIVLGKGNEG